VSRRVAITGIGVVAPGGIGRRAFWDLLTAGRTATRRISLFDSSAFRSQVAAEVDFDGAAHGLTADEVARMDRYVQFALVAADEAVADSGIDLGHERAALRTAVSLGTAVGGTTALEDGYVLASDTGARWLVDPGKADPWLYDALVPSSLAADVAARVGAHGPASTVSTGCTSGIDAIGYGAQLIQDGEADRVIAGASDSPISPISVACFDAIKATTGRNDDPEHASRPFDKARDGFVLAEGGAVVVLEEIVAARARNAHIYCEVAGYSTRSNAFHMTGLRRDGLEMAEAITSAMRQSQLDIDSVGYINAHGSGTLQNDRHETAAFKASFGSHAYRVPISSIKSMVGHSLGAIGAVEVAATALAVQTGVVPPTANLERPDPDCDLDYVPNDAREADVGVALSVGSGFGGFQSAILLSDPARYPR
jgi:minimal PKS ketosynthase (KS/KS alpha)